MSYPELAVHTFTTRGWSMSECIEGYARRGIGGISVWRETLEGEDLCSVRKHMTDAGLEGMALVRGGFFTGASAGERVAAIEKTRECLLEAEALGLPLVVLVCGATPGQTARENYEQIRDGIGVIAEEAARMGIRLSIEPLHPVYAGDRSGICSLRDANNLAGELSLPNVGVAVDVYHVFWEVDLQDQLQRCADHGWLDAYHICDFKPEQEDILLDRGIMGEGSIALGEIDKWVHEAGFEGRREVEIFSRKWWNRDQDEFLDRILEAYDNLYRSG
ncbi:MAG: sugar phosphate isomerase/epimerase family protein [Verrucomicrobiota bacterium]|nr:sugar phosphate isomerase/epimerase family protein [Verrucomicrobiota bacterium]